MDQSESDVVKIPGMAVCDFPQWTIVRAKDAITVLQRVQYLRRLTVAWYLVLVVLVWSMILIGQLPVIYAVLVTLQGAVFAAIFLHYFSKWQGQEALFVVDRCRRIIAIPRLESEIAWDDIIEVRLTQRRLRSRGWDVAYGVEMSVECVDGGIVRYHLVESFLREYTTEVGEMLSAELGLSLLGEEQ